MTELPASAHNESLAGDTLTTLTLNYQWRRFVAIAVFNELKRQLKSDVESEQEQFEAWINELIDDLYNGEIVDGTPVGTILFFIGGFANIPTKWLLCEGQTFHNTVYPELAAALGFSPFYVHPNIVLPNLTERFLYGASLNEHLGDVGGATTHTLTTAEMPSHSHVQRIRNVAGATISTAGFASNAPSPQVNTANTTGDTGGGEAHNNMPPFMRGYWIIKVLP